MGLFAVAAVFLVILNIAVILTPSHTVFATVTENIDGWAWSSTGGWLSMNNTNAGAGGGSYGVNVNPVTKFVSGYGWSTNQGWVCFGTSCTGTTPAGVVSTARIDVSNRLRGWAKFINLTDPDGWISLNCLDTGGAGSCATSNYGPTVNLGTGIFSGYAWHGLAGGLGWGWIDFSGVRMSTTTEATIVRCHDGIDNNLNGSVDCADAGCFQKPALNCPAVETQCSLIAHSNCCYDGDDDDNDALVDCADADCNGQSCGSGCACSAGNKTETSCADAADNDGDTLTDCNDTDCSAYIGCVPEVCDNLVDDNANGLTDCADPLCSGFPACTPAWLKSQFGNVYSKVGVTGNAPPPGEANATYCITTGGTVTNFTSQTGCVEAGQQQLNLPTGGSGYVSNLGRLDVNGILAGRYGTVVPITTDAGIPAVLDGKVYLYDADVSGCPAGGFVLNAKTFNNASGSTARGNGLLVVKGCNLKIAGNLSYQAAGVSQYLRNLASFGALVLAKYSGGSPVANTGEININPSVSQIVGLYFGERTIKTGTTGAIDVQLKVYGALVSRDIQLQRRYGSPTEAAEDVIFDGRGVVNPPPGTQDITKSLPSLKDTF
ncbi:MAG TPA: hypothetical protein VN397_03700 [Candidatus Methylomirabilis sp.]|nr:hypothetical protein [Candidatus Methylomirabilis sp.]